MAWHKSFSSINAKWFGNKIILQTTFFNLLKSSQTVLNQWPFFINACVIVNYNASIAITIKLLFEFPTIRGPFFTYRSYKSGLFTAWNFLKVHWESGYLKQKLQYFLEMYLFLIHLYSMCYFKLCSKDRGSNSFGFSKNHYFIRRCRRRRDSPDKNISIVPFASVISRWHLKTIRVLKYLQIDRLLERLRVRSIELLPDWSML